MPLYTLEYKPPRSHPGAPARGWIDLSVSAKAPFPAAEVNKYRQLIAESLTAYRGVAVMPATVSMRMLCDGAVVETDLFRDAD